MGLSTAMLTRPYSSILSESVLVLVLVYVDDLIITGNSESFITAFIDLLGKQFAMKDLGTLSYFLGMEVHYKEHGLVLSQTKYAKELLQKGRHDRV